MSVMEVQNYLRSGKTLENLKEELGIDHKILENDGIVLLDYNMIEAPKTHPIVIECRSLILSLDDYSIISRKFPRFFNYREAPDYYHDFDPARSVMMEKADGSLVGIYFNPITGRWEVSTRGMAKADGPFLYGGTFREAILEASGFKSEEEFQTYAFSYMSTEDTYIFEFTSPENQIVTMYESPQLVLLGVVRNTDGKFLPLEDMTLVVEAMQSKGVNVRMVRTYDHGGDLDTIVSIANELENLEEGFVVWDQVSGKRMKIKSETYLIAHKLRGNNMVPTRKNILSLIFDGDVDEFLAYFPKMEGFIKPVADEVSGALYDADEQFGRVSSIENQREFAIQISDFPLKSLLFSARKYETTPSKYFNKLDSNQKLRMFKVNPNEE